MDILTIIFVSGLLLLTCLIVGEKLREIFPNSKFTKWWNENVISHTHKEDI